MRQDRSQYRGPFAAVLAALLLAVGLPAAASAERGGGELAYVTVHDAGVELRPQVGHSGATLTVSGNGESYRLELAAGEVLTVDPTTPDGVPLADGHYTWELQLVPPPPVAERLRAAALAGRPSREWSPQSGSFTIRDGRIVDPQEREPAAAVAPAGPTAELMANVGEAPAVAYDLDGRRVREAAAPAAASQIQAVPGGRALHDSDARAGERAAAALESPAEGASSQPSVPRRDPKRDAANGRTDPGNEQ